MKFTYVHWSHIVDRQTCRHYMKDSRFPDWHPGAGSAATLTRWWDVERRTPHVVIKALSCHSIKNITCQKECYALGQILRGDICNNHHCCHLTDTCSAVLAGCVHSPSLPHSHVSSILILGVIVMWPVGTVASQHVCVNACWERLEVGTLTSLLVCIEGPLSSTHLSRCIGTIWIRYKVVLSAGAV
jgi:hypothetical protein